MIIAAVEGGGNTFKVAICRVAVSEVSNSVILPDILYRTEVQTHHDDPNKTLDECCCFLTAHKPAKGYHALGVATFGPVGVHKSSKSYGCILWTSPKAAWRGVNLLQPFRRACKGTLELKVNVETDVNAPAVAEYLFSNRTISSVGYITVGTGVGVGLVIHGKPVHGRMHPEGGHVPVPPLPGDTFRGYSWGVDHCPFQGKNTVEGLACSVALTERLEQMEDRTYSRAILAELDDDHELWDHAANALGGLCSTLLLTLSIEKIVLGGGIVMNRKGLMEKIRRRTVEQLNGYLELPADMSALICTTKFGADAGLVGAMVLAKEALKGPELDEKKMKREAFGQGLWHGFFVGAVLSGLVCKYLVYSQRRK
jgi:fructokinase